MTLHHDLLWSESELPAAVPALGGASGAQCGGASAPAAQEPLVGSDPSLRVAMAAAAADLDVEEVRSRHGELAGLLRRAGPALIPLPGDARSALALLSATRRRARLLANDGTTVVAVPTADVLDRLRAADEQAETPAAAAALEAAGRPPSPRALATLVRGRLRDRTLPPWWLVRRSPGADFWRQCRAAGLGRRLAGFVGAHAVQYACFILSWAVLGRAVLDRRLDGGDLLAWALLLAATVPARIVATRLQASVAIGAGRLLRRRLLHGAFRLEVDEIRREGAGQLLGRVLEAEAVEDLAVSGGLVGLVAAVELTFAVVVLATGAGLGLAALLAVWIAATVTAAWRYVGRRRAWAKGRLRLTHDLVEKMVGHRTRQVQVAPERWHEGEADQLAEYVRLSRSMDRWLSALLALAPRGWVVAGVGLLALEMAGDASAPSVAVGAGGILLGFIALTRLVAGLAQVGDATVAWAQVAPLFDAAARPPAPEGPHVAAPEARRRRPWDLWRRERDVISAESPNITSLSRFQSDGRPPGRCSDGATLLRADDVTYRYPGRERPALAGASLQVEPGDRVLLEGPSGSGKSTLAGLLAGVRRPSDGRVLLHGADLATTGVTAWRRRVVASPQFHENHVLLGSLAFNLLLGRRWPPRPEDLKDAYEVCVALGLGPLVDRMPSGLLQIVGNTGWQLSHGERSLMFLARALLQQPDVVLLDETFGSLDPATHRRAVGVTVGRAKTLVVISH